MAQENRRVVLIGTSHVYQLWDGPGKPTSLQFKCVLLNLCDQYAIAAIAEEMTVEALKEQDTSQSVAQVVCAQLRIRHQFSDAPPDVRKEKSIRQENDIRISAFFKKLSEAEILCEIRQSHAIRERYWLDKLRSLNIWPALFICGADHTGAFELLLRQNGFHVVVAFADWEPEPSI